MFEASKDPRTSHPGACKERNEANRSLLHVNIDLVLVSFGWMLHNISIYFKKSPVYFISCLRSLRSSPSAPEMRKEQAALGC